MPEMGTSGLMSGDGKRGGASASVPAPILDSTCELPTFSRRSPSAETRSAPPKDLDCVNSPNKQALVDTTYKGHSLDQKELHQLTSILRPFTPTPVQNSELFASFCPE